MLLNQFHDIIPGSSIARVYKEAEQAYENVQKSANAAAECARQALLRDGQSLTVFNSTGWTRTDLVELPEGWLGATAADGRPVPVQQAGPHLLAEVQVPPIGCTSISQSPRGPAPSDGGVSASTGHMENDQLRIELNDRGELTRIIDKAADCEISAGDRKSVV